MSDKHPSPNKILFWTDKRPLAPDVETRITCAIAEAMSAIMGVLAQLILVYVLYASGVNRLGDSYAGMNFDDLAILLLLAIVILNLSVGNYLSKLGRGQDLAWQSGIPQARTRTSRCIRLIVYSSLALFMPALILDLAKVDFIDGFLTRHSLEIFAFMIVFGISANVSLAHERLAWVVDLRKQQGHALPFEDHPMAQPMKDGKDWGTKS